MKLTIIQKTPSYFRIHCDWECRCGQNAPSKNENTEKTIHKNHCHLMKKKILIPASLASGCQHRFEDKSKKWFVIKVQEIESK